MPVHSIAHITGGGPTGNIPRVLPDGLEAVIEERSWPRPAVFDWLQRAGNVEREEMHRTFNCGLGMTLCVSSAEADRALGILRRRGFAGAVTTPRLCRRTDSPFEIGRICVGPTLGASLDHFAVQVSGLSALGQRLRGSSHAAH